MSSAGRTPLPSDVLTLSAAGPTRVSSLNPQQEGALIGGINADLGRLTRRSQGMNLTLSVTAIPASNDVVLLIGIVLNPCHFGGGGSLPSLLQVCRKCADCFGTKHEPSGLSRRSPSYTSAPSLSTILLPKLATAKTGALLKVGHESAI